LSQEIDQRTVQKGSAAERPIDYTPSSITAFNRIISEIRRVFGSSIVQVNDAYRHFAHCHERSPCAFHLAKREQAFNTIGELHEVRFYIDAEIDAELARHDGSPSPEHIRMDGAELFCAVMNAPGELGSTSNSEETGDEDMVPDRTPLLDAADADIRHPGGTVPENVAGTPAGGNTSDSAFLHCTHPAGARRFATYVNRHPRLDTLPLPGSGTSVCLRESFQP
jgi:hypothetical protein